MRILSFLFALALLGFLLAGGGAYWGFKKLDAAGINTETKIIFIEQGTPLRGIARILENDGITTDPYVFLINAKLTRVALKAGEYEIPAQASLKAVTEILASGRTYQHKITFPEGLMSFEIIDILKADPVLTGDITSIPTDGELLPDTYNYSRGDTCEEIIKRLRDANINTMVELWDKRAEGLPLKAPFEALTLASIVEKETGIASERARVAGVFINRLRQGMPLQSDPTTIYAITMGKEKLERSLTFKDLEINSPFNTYVAPGLPPAPIANPGRASIEAVLHPEAHDFLYFVADGTGGHVFAKTLGEHNRNVQNWRKIARERR